MRHTIRRLRRSLLEIVLALAAVLFVRTAIAAPYVVPSGSMQPSLLIGDRIVSMPLAFGASTALLPFGDRLPHGPRLFARLPRRGDIVVFRGPAEPDTTLVKRVIGLPGDRVRLSDGRLWLNGSMVPWHDEGADEEELADGSHVPAERITETLPGSRAHLVLKRLAHAPYDDMAELTVPPGRLFVMGDNRDNSADSRIPVAEGGVGLLPLWNLQGRIVLLAASRDILAPAHGLRAWLATLRPERFGRIL